MKNVIWYFKQLLPLSYRSTYRDPQGRKHFATWKMWLGRCYKIDDYVIAG